VKYCFVDSKDSIVCVICKLCKRAERVHLEMTFETERPHFNQTFSGVFRKQIKKMESRSFTDGHFVKNCVLVASQNLCYVNSAKKFEPDRMAL